MVGAYTMFFLCEPTTLVMKSQNCSLLGESWES